MLGLAILFGLFVWLIITVFAIIIGYETGKKFGAFIGFMLTMGGWIVYWIAEYHYIQYKVNHLCKTEGGVTVYVTPEEWRKMIGEEEWQKSVYTGNPDENYPKDDVINFGGREYRVISQINQRVLRYYSRDAGRYAIKNVYIEDFLFYDMKLSKVLYHQRVFSPDISDELNLKFWSGYGVKRCNFSHRFLDKYRYSYNQF